MTQDSWRDTTEMGPRRLPIVVAPLSDEFYENAKKLIARYPQGRERSALLPLLYLVQSEHGFVSPEGQRAVGEILGLTRAEVAAVSTFYTMFKRTPQGKWLISVCTQPACSLAGAKEIVARLQERLGIANGETTGNGMISLEEVECLCVCDGAPVVAVNYENYEKIGVEEAVDLVMRLMEGEAPPPAARGDVPPDFAAVNRRMSGLEAPR